MWSRSLSATFIVPTCFHFHANHKDQSVHEKRFILLAFYIYEQSTRHTYIYRLTCFFKIRFDETGMEKFFYEIHGM